MQPADLQSDGGSSSRVEAPRLPYAAGLLRDLFTLQRYRITVEGVTLVVFSGLIGFAAWHSGTNLLYLVFATTVAIFLTQGLLVWLGIRGLRGQRLLPQHVYAGRICPVTVKLFNRKRAVSSRALKVLDLDSHGAVVGAAFFGNVPRNESVELEYTTVFPKRGLHHLCTLEAITRFPFGLVERGVKLRADQDVLVYPAVYEMGDLAADLFAGFGEESVGKKGSGTELYGLREYVQGEHARHIHWRSSAKSQKLMVIEYEKDERRHITLQLWNVSTREGSKSRGQDFESAVSMVATLANHLLDAGFEVRLSTASGATADGQGRAHLYSILRGLATLKLLKPGEEHANPELAGAIVQVIFQDDDPAVKWASTNRLIIDAREYELVNRRYRLRVGR